MLLLINALTGSQSHKLIQRAMEKAKLERSEVFHTTLVAIGRGVRSLVSPVTTTLANLRNWHSRVKTIAELEALDDRTLDDIGLTRGNIRAVATALTGGRQSKSVASIVRGFEATDDCVDPNADCYNAA